MCNQYMVGNLNKPGPFSQKNPNVNVQNPGLSKDERTVCQARDIATSSILIYLKVIQSTLKSFSQTVEGLRVSLGYMPYSLKLLQCNSIPHAVEL